MPADGLLDAAGRPGSAVDHDELVEVVEPDDKRRISVDASGDLIRANQGHSVEVDPKLEQSGPPEVFYWSIISKIVGFQISEITLKSRLSKSGISLF